MKGLWIYPSAILTRLGLTSFAIATLLVVSIGPRSARADTVNYDLSISGAGAPTVVGSSVLEYDTFSQMFTNLSFEVSWDSVLIPLYTQAMATDPTQSYSFLISVGSNGDYEAELINSDALMVVYAGETGPNGPPSFTDYYYAATLTSSARTRSEWPRAARWADTCLENASGRASSPIANHLRGNGVKETSRRNEVSGTFRLSEQSEATFATISLTATTICKDYA